MSGDFSDLLFAAIVGAAFWFGSRDGERTERKRWIDAIEKGGSISWKEKMRREIVVTRMPKS